MDVLIVDDDADLARNLAEVLALLELRSAHAPSGEAALLHLRGSAHLPGLVLLDLHMDRVDGWSVLSEMRAEPALARIPVVVMTGYSDAADRRSPVVAFLKKPFSMDDVGAIVARVLRPRAPPGC